MKAMIALAMLTLTCQVWASSFDNFDQTNTVQADAHSIIIKTKSSINIQALGFNRSVMASQPIIQQMQLHLLQLNPVLNVDSVLAELQRHPQVVYAQLNHKVTMRNAEIVNVIVEDEQDPVIPFAGPDDTDFNEQWSMELTPTNFGIDAITAWSKYGTGGKDASNNDIVVAVVDGGIQVDHPDLKENIWINEQEIPGNGIDDDNNGYVDDITGWNGYTDSGQQKSDYHGTHVAGTVGAKGNNDLQVAGVNWDVKIMNVPGSSGNTDVVLRAYNYILKQKQLWLATDGAQGANIVATNSSFGIDRANCRSGRYPAWNDVYNEMGKVGILSAAATMNNSSNVDVVGDVPTGCDSPYIVAVTNNRANGRRSWAAYGKNSIDLGAPGDRIISTVTGGGTAKLSGTSMATPHVAGAVAFLNSIASQDLQDLYKNDPGQAALEMKRMIMETVTKIPGSAWEQETVSGGILNLNQAAEAVVNFEMPVQPPVVEEEEPEVVEEVVAP